MADAPSGGGSSWGAFEVILALLLGIALLSAISNKGVATPPFKETTKKETISKVDDSANRCGLSISAPLSMQKTYGSVRLSGLTSGCNWPLEGTTALFAQVINGAGVPVSDFITVQKNDSDILNNAFDTTIQINGNPTGTGYLILIPAKQQEGKSITVRIPLQFVRN
jgi:hypothetical protein